MTKVDLWILRQVWGNTHFDFVSSSARGLSGGIISVWNNKVFIRANITCNHNYIVVDGFWAPGNVNMRWINIYAPQDLPSKIALWSSLSDLINSWDGISVLMGDFNEVRDACERYGSVFSDRQANFFNEFINEASLIDIPLGGYNFTWTDKWGSKMSKLDRFLASENFFEYFPHSKGIVLEKGIPDHRPILLKESQIDYGPTPFRFFHSWLELEGFHDLVTHTWNNDGIAHANGLVLFKKKLQNLKKAIREWVGSKKSESFALKKEHQKRLSTVDEKINSGIACDEDLKCVGILLLSWEILTV